MRRAVAGTLSRALASDAASTSGRADAIRARWASGEAAGAVYGSVLLERLPVITPEPEQW